MKKIYLLLLAAILLLSPEYFSQCTPTTVPYYEGFNSVTSNNQFPNCWSSSSPSVNCVTFAGGNPYAAFASSPTGTNYFISAPITFSTSYTYSAGIWYRPGASGGANWSNLRILVAPAQNTNAAVTVAAINGTISVTNTYSSLSGPFTVPANNTYVIIISVIATGTSPSSFLDLDDLNVTYPCGPSSGNVIPILNFQPSYTVCSNANTVTLGANIAGSMFSYSWSTGSTNSVIIVAPQSTTFYSLTVTHLVTACTATAGFTINVDPVPQISVLTSSMPVCAGSGVTLTASGAQVYSLPSNPWVMHPTSNSSYTVFGSTGNCTGTAVVQFSVLPIPVFTISTLRDSVCADVPMTLNASGNFTFQWKVNATSGTGSTFTYVPNNICTFSVTATTVDGCQSTRNKTIQVDDCTGIISFFAETVIIYPNPASKNIILQMDGITEWNIKDVSGRMVLCGQSKDVDVSRLSTGLYIICIRKDQQQYSSRFVKEMN